MSDHDALLAGVLAHPDADLPRLVYADFIEENGDATRAEFIRVQCALAGGHFEDEKEKAALELRERYLREKHGPAWLAPLKKKGEPLFTPRSHGLFRRGFVECVWMPAAWFVQKAEKLFARCPVNELRVTMGTAAELIDVVQSPHFQRLTTLDVSNRSWRSPYRISFLDHSRTEPLLRGVKRLRLRSCFLDDFDAHLLCTAKRFSPLELDVTGNPFSREWIDNLRAAHGDALICDEPQ
jgi:uncharacterized protein (TIGR02996 family)